MSEQEKYQLKLDIAQIIDTSRYAEEMFLVDSKSAADRILSHLKQKNLLLNAEDNASY